MKIGIVGLGVVGSAVQYGFEKLGHNVKLHDIQLDTTINDVLDTEICYVCVPTPENDDDSCDTSIVEDVIKELVELNYKGIITIKSTVAPGTTIKLKEKYNINNICFVPEFLRERCAITDFTENHDVCIVGTDDDYIFEKIKKCHGKYPKKFIKIDETGAELCKYYNNIYNATLITFANSFYEVCKRLGVNYTKVKDAVVNIDHITDLYIDCNENFRGFGGVCLPKDTKAIASLCKQMNIDVDFFQMLIDENKKYKVTVFGGMRA
jgi:UDPglucose 6-dehydrogenase